MTDKFFRAKELVMGAKVIGLVSHVRMDPDAFGCLLGLKETFEKMGKKVLIFSEEGDSAFVHDVDPEITYEFTPAYQKIDLIMICDTAILDRIAAPSIIEKIMKRPGVVLDHHASEFNELENYIYLVEKRASASEICYEFVKESGFPISRRAASMFYVGLLSDTNDFKFLNTTEHTKEIGKEIQALSYPDIRERIEFAAKKDLETKIDFYEHCYKLVVKSKKFPVVITPITAQDLNKYKMTEGIGSQVANYMEDKTGKGSFVFMEIPGGMIKASLRSNKVDLNVREIAEKFGGGGHDLASGFMVKSTLDEIVKKFC